MQPSPALVGWLPGCDPQEHDKLLPRRLPGKCISLTFPSAGNVFCSARFKVGRRHGAINISVSGLEIALSRVFFFYFLDGLSVYDW